MASDCREIASRKSNGFPNPVIGMADAGLQAIDVVFIDSVTRSSATCTVDADIKAGCRTDWTKAVPQSRPAVSGK
jgi:hypothetical protein